MTSREWLLAIYDGKPTARLFEDCRWICASCHSIQPVTSPENVVAMYQTIHELDRV